MLTTYLNDIIFMLTLLNKYNDLIKVHSRQSLAVVLIRISYVYVITIAM